MKPELFRTLVEKKHLTKGTNVEAHYDVETNGKMKKSKASFVITGMYSHPFAFNTIVVLENEQIKVEVDFDAIKKIEGLEPPKFAAQFKIRPDGKSDDAPKRRGRKPKVRPEADLIDEEEDDEEELNDQDVDLDIDLDEDITGNSNENSLVTFDPEDDDEF